MIQRVLILAALIFPIGSFAAVTLYSRVDKATLKEGESFRFEVVLEAPDSMNLSLPEIGTAIRGMRIVDFGTERGPVNEGRLSQTRWLILEPDVYGSYVLPEVGLEYEDEQGEKKRVSTSEIFVEVIQAEAAAEASDIADIKPVLELPWKAPVWLQIFAAVAALTALSALIWWFLRRRALRRPKPERPAHEWALCELDDLKRDGLLERGEYRRFAFGLSELVRRYVEGRYQFPATDLTYEQMRDRIDSLHFDSELREQFLEVLEQMDLVKFADQALTVETGNRYLEAVEAFVQKTRPVADAMKPSSAVSQKATEDFL